MSNRVVTSTRTEPFRIRYPRPDDTGEGSRVVGYRKRCSCGRRSPLMSSVAAARTWVNVHTASGHRG